MRGHARAPTCGAVFVVPRDQKAPPYTAGSVRHPVMYTRQGGPSAHNAYHSPQHQALASGAMRGHASRYTCTAVFVVPRYQKATIYSRQCPASCVMCTRQGGASGLKKRLRRADYEEISDKYSGLASEILSKLMKEITHTLTQNLRLPQPRTQSTVLPSPARQLQLSPQSRPVAEDSVLSPLQSWPLPGTQSSVRSQS